MKSSTTLCLLLLSCCFCSPAFSRSNSSDFDVKNSPETEIVEERIELIEELEPSEIVNEPQIGWNYRGDIWTEDDLLMVRLALNYLSRTINKSNVRECVTSRTLKYEGIDEEQAVIDFDALANVSKWPNIIIQAKNEDAGWAGRAFKQRIIYGELNQDNIGELFFSLEGKNPGIIINLKHLHSDRDNYGDEVAYKNLAGVILHELLHQMGHGHPTTGDYAKDYLQGHFITVAGDCLTTDGLTARGTSIDSSMSAGTGYYGSKTYVPTGGWRRID
jgi:hypothetical protein